MLQKFPFITLLTTAAIVSFTPLANQTARAEEPVPTVDDIVKALTPLERTRSFRTRGISGVLPDDEPRKMDLSDSGLFALGSAELTDAGRAALENYVKAFNERSLKPYTFLITGHASRDGAESFNIKLSERRAEVARQYIISRGVDSDRIKIAWFGSNILKDPANPNGAQNRRFEITNCGKEADSISQCEKTIKSSLALGR